MREITLKMPDKKLSFFMELMRQLGIQVADDLEIPEEHKAIVRERIKKTDKNPERLLDREQVKDDFKLD